jgi:tetratricopeptide (TPR) repeat protein
MTATIIDFAAKKKIQDAKKADAMPAATVCTAPTASIASTKKKRTVVPMGDKRIVRSQRQAEALFRKANDLDEDPATRDEAENLYIRCLALDPLCANACTNLGSILYKKKKYEEAVRLFEQAIALNPRDASALYNLGNFHFERDLRETLTDKEKEWMLETAISWYSRALAIDSRCIDAHYHVAMAYEMLCRRALARPHWKMFLRLTKKEAAYTTYAQVAKNYLEKA